MPAAGIGDEAGRHAPNLSDPVVEPPFSQETAHELEQHFTMLAEAIPQLVWSTDRDGMVDYVNSGWCHYTGQGLAASAGNGWQDFVHPDDIEATRGIWQDALGDRGRYDLEYRLRRADGEYRWMLVRGRAVLDRTGQASRWIGTCTDIHETKLASEHNAALSRELGHRIKNIFAVIDGLIGMSVREQPPLATLGADLRQRVLALGRAHDFIRPHSETSRPALPPGTLSGMLTELLSPYRNVEGHQRIALTGGDIAIDDRSATPLALAFHELATNAAKYGALSVLDGRVRVGVEPAGETVLLEWSEAGGPSVTKPTHHGFGTSLIDISLRRQLGGEIAWDWTGEGLRFQAVIPRSSMARA